MKRFNDLIQGDVFWLVYGVYASEPIKCVVLNISESEFPDNDFYYKHIKFEYKHKNYNGQILIQEQTISLDPSLPKLNKIEDDGQFCFNRYYLNRNDAINYIHNNEVYFQTKPNDYFDRMRFYSSFIKWHHMYSFSSHGYSLDDEHAKSIIEMGFRAIPYLEEIFKEDPTPHVNMLLNEIRKNIKDNVHKSRESRILNHLTSIYDIANEGANPFCNDAGGSKFCNDIKELIKPIIDKVNKEIEVYDIKN